MVIDQCDTSVEMVKRNVFGYEWDPVDNHIVVVNRLCMQLVKVFLCFVDKAERLTFYVCI